MKKQNLIVVTGPYSSGKNCVSKYLESELGFFRTCVDEIINNGIRTRSYSSLHYPHIFI